MSFWRKLLGGPAVRGRIHKVSIVAGGEVSVVLRFGVEESEARALDQGALIELRVLPAPPAAVPTTSTGPAAGRRPESENVFPR